jgi:hypothetical protein
MQKKPLQLGWLFLVLEAGKDIKLKGHKVIGLLGWKVGRLLGNIRHNPEAHFS